MRQLSIQTGYSTLRISSTGLLKTYATYGRGRQEKFKHDGAQAYSTISVRNYLHQMYPKPWMRHYGPFPWSARSLDFLFWGGMKELVYSTPIVSKMDLIALLALSLLHF
ncbi:hypothetical protein PR048_014684 [Dryococelus australis]|uniref:Uncharacterized protein n=1 Tax=Dryococelus australis TaxID=614101 RepID=A0ABQ9HEX5_9NEOP|nr:hypothetical protein PR048_014684 [Dryococelus australis]